jgi:hypothetical protein
MATRVRPHDLDVAYLDRFWQTIPRLASLPTVAIMGGIVLIGALLRFWSLASWPIFSDEDVYVVTAVLVSKTPFPESLFVAAMNTYKGPMHSLVHAGFVWLGADSLLVGRTMSAVAGLATTIMTWELGRRVGGRAVGLMAATLYALSPMAVVHERMITFDPALAALTLAATLASLSAVERRSWPLVIVAAVASALAVQAKTPGIAVAAAPILALFLYPNPARPAMAHAIAIVMAAVASYLSLLLSPLAPILNTQNAMLLVPFGGIVPNLVDVLDALWTYFPAGLALFLVPGAVLAFRESPRVAIAMAIMTMVWVAPWIVLSKFAPSRYYLSALPFVCAFVALALVRLPGFVRTGSIRTVARILTVVMVVTSGVMSAQLVIDHAGGAMPRLDDWQYRSGWPSGYGYREADSLVRRTAEPGSSVAYLIDQYHGAGAGVHAEMPDGVTSLGMFDGQVPLPNVAGRLYVIADDGRDRQFMDGTPDHANRITDLLAQRPDLELIARFPRPGTNLGVSVLRSR